MYVLYKARACLHNHFVSLLYSRPTVICCVCVLRDSRSKRSQHNRSFRQAECRASQDRWNAPTTATCPPLAAAPPSAWSPKISSAQWLDIKALLHTLHVLLALFLQSCSKLHMSSQLPEQCPIREEATEAVDQP